MHNKEIHIVLSGGGTGGHIFPALAIAHAFESKIPGTKILFIGAKGRMEMEKIPAAGYPIEGLWISGLQRRFTWGNFLFPLKVVSSWFKARAILKKFRPDAVIGTGGYASWSALNAAVSLGIPTLIQEQNSFPGITNKKLAKKADKICVAYSGMEKYFPKGKLALLGNPIRKEIEFNLTPKEEAVRFFKLDPGKPVLLVVGGSLGARTINQSIESNLQQFADAGIQVLWQTGKSYAETAQNAIKPFSGKGIQSMPFIQEMDKAYAAADVVVSRAGAIAVSELCASGKPMILVPSPNVAEDHQTKNAMALVSQNAALLVTDEEAPEKLGKTITGLVNNKQIQNELAINSKKLAVAESASKIADEILKLIK